MRAHMLLIAAAAAALAAGPVATTSAAAPPDSPHLAVPAASSPRAPAPSPLRMACPPVRPGHVRCLVEYRPSSRAGRAADPAAARAATSPQGWGARSIQSAYRLPVARGAGQTVAIADPYNTPGLPGYLARYRAQYGLPACTTANGCLRRVNQQGHASPLPGKAIMGWDLETTLDVDMVSAACPRCKILLAEARTSAIADLAAAENTAARLGAQVISNSYGASEDGFDMTFARAYDHPGHAIVVSSGDVGYAPASFPASLATVTAVGGTQLARARNRRGWRETVWQAGSSACSAYVSKPSWQHDKVCPTRTVADVAALAANVAVYEKTYGGWLPVGGTSAAAPLTAGIYALAGNAIRIGPGYVYQHRGSLFDITSGTNDIGFGTGAACEFTYVCVARRGYGAPTGLGTPDGTRSF